MNGIGSSRFKVLQHTDSLKPCRNFDMCVPLTANGHCKISLASRKLVSNLVLGGKLDRSGLLGQNWGKVFFFR